MPAESKAQLAHLRRINTLPQVTAHRFKKGQHPANFVEGAIRNDKRKICFPCVDCKTLCSGYDNKTGRCKSCAYKFRSQQKRRRLYKSGYVYISSGNRPKPEHIEIAERVLGRELKSKEHVHHINMNKADNRNSNLLICSPSYHKWLHEEYGRRFVQEHFHS